MLTRQAWLAMLVGGFVALPVQGQPPDPSKALMQLTGAKAAELEQAVRGVSAYPKRTRAAILDLAMYAQRHESLLADLARLRQRPSKEIDAYLTSNNYEAGLQSAAATVLVEAPETIDRMQERPDLVKIVGTAWASPPGRELITAVLDAVASQGEKKRSSAADQWAGRLHADPALMQQYVQLLEEYTKKMSAAGQQQDDSWKSYGYGIYKSGNGYVVTDVPSQEVINYALAVGYQYSALASALIQQYLYQENQSDYKAAVGGWYSNYGNTVPDSTRQQYADYYDMLQELSKYAEAAAAAYSGDGSQSGSGSGSGGSQSGDSGSSGSQGGDSGSGSGSDGYKGKEVQDYLAANANKYPKLAQWAKDHPAKDMRVGNKVPHLQEGDGPGKGPGQGAPGGNNRSQFPGGDKPPFGGDKGPPGLGGDKGGPPFGGDKGPPGLGGGKGGPPGLGGDKGAPGGAGGSPFSDKMRATPPENRARPTPQGGRSPFAGGGQMPSPGGAPKIGGGSPGGRPQQIVRGSPPMGQQLTRAQGQMHAAWKPHGGGGPKPAVRGAKRRRSEISYPPPLTVRAASSAGGAAPPAAREHPPYPLPLGHWADLRGACREAAPFSRLLPGTFPRTWRPAPACRRLLSVSL
jgi:hypothetical protein